MRVIRIEDALIVAKGRRRAQARCKSKIWGKAMGRRRCRMAAVAMFALVAPGRVEPRSGEIKVMAPMIGIVSKVLVQTGDKVIADEPLIHLDDEEARARIATSQA